MGGSGGAVGRAQAPSQVASAVIFAVSSRSIPRGRDALGLHLVITATGGRRVL